MRRIALINQKGGVGKTTTAVNLAAALAEAGRRVVVVDLDPQANLTMHLGLEVAQDQPSTYGIFSGKHGFAEALRETETPGVLAVAADIDLSGAELELASAFGRETILREAIAEWRSGHDGAHDGSREPADYLLFDCPPSLGLLAINGLTSAEEVFLAVQTQFFALQGMTKLIEVIQLVQKRLNPSLRVGGIVPCLYDSRQRLAREVLGEIRRYFPGQVFRHPIGTNVKLAEAPSFGQTILQYAPESSGARDYRQLAAAVIEQEIDEAGDVDDEAGSEPTRVVQPAPPADAGGPRAPAPRRTDAAAPRPGGPSPVEARAAQAERAARAEPAERAEGA